MEHQRFTMDNEAILDWAAEPLSELLGGGYDVESARDVAGYLLSMESNDELVEYLYEVLGKTPVSENFVSELLARRMGAAEGNGSGGGGSSCVGETTAAAGERLRARSSSAGAPAAASSVRGRVVGLPANT